MAVRWKTRNLFKIPFHTISDKHTLLPLGVFVGSRVVQAVKTDLPLTCIRRPIVKSGHNPARLSHTFAYCCRKCTAGSIDKWQVYTLPSPGI
jgi:hypothetical protein